jgi:DNA-binding MarR family transcriptional regulator
MPTADRLRVTARPGAAEWALVCLSVAAGYVAQAWAEVCARHNLTLDQYNVLRILGGAPEGHPRHEIAGRLVRRAPDVTRLLDRLEQQGLVKRARPAENRRHSVARITPAGRARLRAVTRDMAAADARLTHALTPTQLDQLATFCDALVP